MKKRLAIFFFILFFAVFNVVFASNISIVDNMNGSVNITSDDPSPFWVCWDYAPVSPLGDDNSLTASTDNPFVFDANKGLVSAGLYTCRVWDGPSIPVSAPSTQNNGNGDVMFQWDGSNIISSGQNEVIGSIPADNATNVSALIPFSGFYSNDGTAGYSAIEISITNNGNTELFRCADVVVGQYIPFSCNISGAVNTQYDYNTQMCDLTQIYPFGCLTDTTKTFTTGYNYAEPPTFGGNDCATFDVGCYITNSFQWLFIPSQNSLDNYMGLYDLFIQKPPFGYVVAINNELSALNDSGTETFTLETMPILDNYIFDPIRTALTWILWLAFAFVLYHRLKNIHL